MDDPNADTEWNDILRAKGILPPKDEKRDDEIEDEFVDMVRAKEAELNSLDNKDLDELDELEDLEDDRILNEYRHKRMMEMQAQAAKEKYGEVIEISKPDFVREVTDASKECFVVVHLYKEYIPACKLMNRCLAELALQFKSTKFIKIVSDQCIPNFPDHNVPTLLIYGEGDLKANLAGAIQFDGMKMTSKSLRAVLAQYGAVPAEKGLDQGDDEKPKRSVYQSKATAALSSDEESDGDDREPMGNKLSNYSRLDNKELQGSRLDVYAELTSVKRGTRIEHVSDEFFGKAENLIKEEGVHLKDGLLQEGIKDGWQTKRHLKSATVVIALGCTGTIIGFDIDTTGYMDDSPSKVVVEGYVESQKEKGKWIILLPHVTIEMNSHNFFKIHHDQYICSRLKLTSVPGGGIARFRCYGQVVPIWKSLNQQYNLASANLGAQIVRWTDVDYNNKPNILLDNGTSQSDGWLTPRSRAKPRNDFVIIQLATTGIIEAVVIDTTSFDGNCPDSLLIEGCQCQEVDPYRDPGTEWFNLIEKTSCFPNNQIVYSIAFGLPVSHIRLTLFPDGGIQQIQILGVPYEHQASTTIINEEREEEEEREEKEQEKRVDDQTTKEIDDLLFPAQDTVLIKTKKRKTTETVSKTPKESLKTQGNMSNKPSKRTTRNTSN
ncbi:hypothetical protein G6F46_000241 [Rhizopus delemar]|uniref:Allantoicase n=2 Tax=Rhizopus TaxID=4842 RepID=A0A9P6ZFT6_9FUNG|nr:hypothetical protein G6F55_000152 [Rhizopus delemar]KAG1553520.1 hypothetical protein G6F51_000554 [Rhizopus arrhizus]KAG1503126.1 hypothetical protein G6F54_001886 [Rhizopus delemar]KAG1518811.1 hypothetical protein G6F53_000282 [Rhizopus delemar]KAG1528693.1 hypothetical protein G6F52_000415 [Rhizopus delemar]